MDGVNLPPTATGYTVLKSDGQAAQGVSVQLSSPGARSAILQVAVSASTPSGAYQLRAQNAAGFDTFPLQILPEHGPGHHCAATVPDCRREHHQSHRERLESPARYEWLHCGG